jgi:Phage gp6-like head-tail connector protein
MHSIISYTEATDAVGPELITLEELKLHLGITTTTEDERLESAITLASELIAAYCGRRFAFANAIETFTFDEWEQTRNNAALTLDLYPVVEIESVVSNGSELDETAYPLDAVGGLLWIASGRWSGTIVVTYSGGYFLPDEAPAALTAAVIESIRLRQFTTARDPSISSLSHGDTRVSYFETAASTIEGGFSPTVMNLLNPYRRLVAA